MKVLGASPRPRALLAGLSSDEAESVASTFPTTRIVNEVAEVRQDEWDVLLTRGGLDWRTATHLYVMCLASAAMHMAVRARPRSTTNTRIARLAGSDDHWRASFASGQGSPRRSSARFGMTLCLARSRPKCTRSSESERLLRFKRGPFRLRPFSKRARAKQLRVASGARADSPSVGSCLNTRPRPPGPALRSGVAATLA